MKLPFPQEFIAESFEEVVTNIDQFIKPVIELILDDDKISCTWTACEMRIALRGQIKNLKISNELGMEPK